jgi:hypothetical protein
LGIKTDEQVERERTQGKMELDSYKTALEEQKQNDERAFKGYKAQLAERELELSTMFESMNQAMEARRLKLSHMEHMLNAEERILEERRLAVDSQLKLLDIGSKVNQLEESNIKSKMESLKPRKPRRKKISIGEDSLEISEEE